MTSKCVFSPRKPLKLPAWSISSVFHVSKLMGCEESLDILLRECFTRNLKINIVMREISNTKLSTKELTALSSPKAIILVCLASMLSVGTRSNKTKAVATSHQNSQHLQHQLPDAVMGVEWLPPGGSNCCQGVLDAIEGDSL